MPTIDLVLIAENLINLDNLINLTALAKSMCTLSYACSFWLAFFLSRRLSFLSSFILVSLTLGYS